VFDCQRGKDAIESALCALELAREDERLTYPSPRDYIWVYWLIGAAYRANNGLTSAEQKLSKALNLCRQIYMVDHETNILLDLVRLRYDQKKFEKPNHLLMNPGSSPALRLRSARRGCESIPCPIRAGAGEGQSQGKGIRRGSVETRHLRRSAVLLQGGG